MTLSLAEASSIVDAAIIKARQLDVTVCVAVCDRLGSLIALNRMDGAYETINRYSVGKAVVSAGTGLPSGDVVGIVDHPPVSTAVAQGLPAIRVRGGLPICRGGAVEGGCGVAGALSHEQDEDRAMSKSLGRNQDLFLRALASLTSERGPGRYAVSLILQRAFELSDQSREREDSEGPPLPSFSQQWLSLKDLETDLNPSRVLTSLTNRGLIDGRNGYYRLTPAGRAAAGL